MKLTQEIIKEYVEDLVDDVVSNCDKDTSRDELIETLDEYCDSLWGNLVQGGLITDYTPRDLVNTAQACAEIIEYAEDRAWVEDDSGLWEGLTYGVLASMAYFSLRNILYQALEDKGIDSNDNYPFAKDED